MKTLIATASQTVGPFLHIGLDWLTRDQLVPDGSEGERITVEGVLIDGNGSPVPDGVIEIWQANERGEYVQPQVPAAKPHAAFSGFGRMSTDEQGKFRFYTIKPGRVAAADGRLQAPHIAMSVFARGIIKRMATRIYFADEASNADDPILQLVPAERRITLIAQLVNAAPKIFRFNVILQGEWQGQSETVFFDF